MVKKCINQWVCTAVTTTWAGPLVEPCSVTYYAFQSAGSHSFGYPWQKLPPTNQKRTIWLITMQGRSEYSKYILSHGSWCGVRWTKKTDLLLASFMQSSSMTQHISCNTISQTHADLITSNKPWTAYDSAMDNTATPTSHWIIAKGSAMDNTTTLTSNWIIAKGSTMANTANWLQYWATLESLHKAVARQHSLPSCFVYGMVYVPKSFWIYHCGGCDVQERDQHCRQHSLSDSSTKSASHSVQSMMLPEQFYHKCAEQDQWYWGW